MPEIKSIYFYHDPDRTGIDYFDQDDEEACIDLVDGRRLYCWFFTLARIEEVMKKNLDSGEDLSGSFFWANNVIVIRSIKKPLMVSVLKYLIEIEEDISAFGHLDPLG